MIVSIVCQSRDESVGEVTTPGDFIYEIYNVRTVYIGESRPLS